MMVINLLLLAQMKSKYLDKCIYARMYEKMGIFDKKVFHFSYFFGNIFMKFSISIQQKGVIQFFLHN